MLQGRITPGQEKDYILAGKAVFTVQNTETGGRFTFQVVKAKPYAGQSPDQAPWFVKVLTGPDNTWFSYLGVIWGNKNTGTYRHGRKSRILKSAPSSKAFRWLWHAVNNGGLPNKVKLYHEGKCGRCGRRLTVPKSIITGFGPECRSILGIH